MEIGAPRFVRGHAVLGLAGALPENAQLDETFIAAVASDFPNVVSRQPPLAGLPAGLVPRLVLTSSSSQLVVTATQADFEVRFYGDYMTNVRSALEYVGRKLERIRQGFEAIEHTPTNIGVIATFNFSAMGQDERPAQHVLETHLNTEVDPELVQDAIARIALRVRDTYFVNLGVSNYEARVWERPIMPGAPQPVIKAWEGKLEDTGVELTVDINNGLEVRTKQADVDVTSQGVQAVLELLERVAKDAGPRYVETGEIAVDALIEEPA